MRCFVIGANGYVGQAIIRALGRAGHSAEGLVRNEAAAAAVAAIGATPLTGDLEDAQALISHLARFDAILFAPQLDRPEERRAVTVLLEALSGSGKAFIMTSGTAVLSRKCDGSWTEDSYAEDEGFEGSGSNERVQTEMLVRSFADRKVKAMVVRPPMIWGHGRCPPLSALHHSARTGAICYFGAGLNVCSSIHVDDLADIFLLAIEKGQPGALYHAVSGETNWRSIAEHIALLRKLPTRSIGSEEAERLFGPFLAPIVFQRNLRTRCPRARKDLGWAPHSDRLDLFGELGHPTFMAIDPEDDSPFDFTLAEPLRKGRHEG